MKNLIGIALIGAMSFALGACDDRPSADDDMNSKQEQLAQEANRQTGVPAIKNFNRKKTLKTIIEAVDNDKTINYAYLFAENTGKLVFIGKCQGYGIPASTQYSNPQKPITYHTIHGQYDAMALPQADPDGLFSPGSADGTWLMLINPETKEPVATYFEPKIVVSPFPINPKY